MAGKPWQRTRPIASNFQDALGHLAALPSRQCVKRPVRGRKKLISRTLSPSLCCRAFLIDSFLSPPRRQNGWCVEFETSTITPFLGQERNPANYLDYLLLDVSETDCFVELFCPRGRPCMLRGYYTVPKYFWHVCARSVLLPIVRPPPPPTSLSPGASQCRVWSWLDI